MMAFRTLRSKCALLAPVCLMVLGAAGSAAADTINVAWDPSGSTVGYKVHVGVQSGSYTNHFDAGNSTTFAFTTATAGQRYCFAVSAYSLSSQVEGPNSSEVCGYSNAPPTLVNPGDRTSTVGQPTSLQLQGYDSQPLTYSHGGLPPGLSMMSSTGYISGTGTTAGIYTVTVLASDGTLSARQTFTWTMTTSSTSSSGTGGTTTPTGCTTATVSICTPTTETSYSTTQSSITLTGSASPAITRVVWENTANGARGVASGTTSWTIANIPLLAGSNLIEITAYDAAGNPFIDRVLVTRSSTTSTGGGTTDTTKPTVSIGAPTTGSTYSTTQPTINLSGSAADDRGVVQVAWMNSAGGSGVASGTTSWSIASLPLQSGTNVISMTALDAAGNAATATLTVTRSTTTSTPSTGGAPTLSVERLGSSSMRLSWTYTSWSSVDVYRNGLKVKNTSNDGSTNDNVNGHGSYTYRLCAPGSTTVCSNSVSISN